MTNKATGAPRKVVVVGGSQGAIEALLEIVAQLPRDFAAPIFIVVHLPTEADTYLPNMLSRAGALQVHRAKEGDTFRAGQIYVAPPNFHLTLERDAMRVRKGPRENRHRPAIDPLFRTAARAFGPSVIAVVLSGNLDDGSAGLFAIRTRGGKAIVQDPASARADEMPRRALDYAGADYVVPLAGIAEKLIELVNSRDVAMKKKTSMKARASGREVRANEEVAYIGEGNGKPSVFACPECHGVLWELKEGRLVRYRCRVGHSYTSASLKGELDESAERALWAAMRALEEKAAMSQRMIDATTGPKSYLNRLKEQASSDKENAGVIRKIIFTEGD